MPDQQKLPALENDNEVDAVYASARMQQAMMRIWEKSQRNHSFTLADARRMALAALRAWQKRTLESRKR